jgi:DNA-binding beta-propeller fold protein YncE
MAADTPNRIIVAVWGDRDVRTGQERPGSSNYVIEVNGNGDVIKRWTQWDSLFTTPHQVYISPYDPERSIYIIERGGNKRGPNGETIQIHEAVYKFSNDGSRLIWGLVDPAPKNRTREGPQPPGHTDFGDPSVLTFLPDGRHFLLADGYQNGRVQTWTTDGQYVREFGMIDYDPGPAGAPGAFDLMHGIAVDRAGRIYVGDRNNNRIQVFTPNGDFIEEWPGIVDPVGIYVDDSEAIWVVSAALNRLLKYNTKGELLYHFGTHGRTSGGFAGGFARTHEVDVDSAGNVYVSSWDWPGYLTRLTPRPGADPAKLIGQKLGTRRSSN